MSVKLSAAALQRIPSGIAVPKYGRSDLSAGILHYGVGNFHRAHQAVYLDALFNAEEGTTLLLVLSDSDDESVKQFAAPVNEVEVSVGNGIERAGVDGGNLFQCASRGRK